MIDLKPATTTYTGTEVAVLIRDALNAQVGSTEFTSEITDATIEITNAVNGDAIPNADVSNMPAGTTLTFVDGVAGTSPEVNTIKIGNGEDFLGPINDAYYFTITTPTTITPPYYLWFNLTDVTTDNLVSLKVNGTTRITEQLTINGGIDETPGIEFNPQTTNPADGTVWTGTEDNTLWVNATSSLQFGSSTVLTTTPSTSTDNAIVRFDGTTATNFQNTNITIDDNDLMSGAIQIKSERFATSVNSNFTGATSFDIVDTTPEGVYVLNTAAGGTNSQYDLPTPGADGRQFTFRNASSEDNMEIRTPGPIVLDTLTENQFLVVQEVETSASTYEWITIMKGNVSLGGVNVVTVSSPTDIDLTGVTADTFILNTTTTQNQTYLLPAATAPGRKYTFRNLSSTADIIIEKQGSLLLATLDTNDYAIVQEMDLGTGNDWVVLFQSTSAV